MSEIPQFLSGADRTSLEQRVFAAWQTSVIKGKGEFKEKESEYWSSCEISDKMNLGDVWKVEIMEWKQKKALFWKIRSRGASIASGIRHRKMPKTVLEKI